MIRFEGNVCENLEMIW